MDNGINPQSRRLIADLKPGDHLCCLYQTEEEHRALLTPYLRQGLERREKVLCIVDDHSAETILGYLRDDGLDVEPYLARGQLAFFTRQETYLRPGVFDPDEMIALLRESTQQALAEGYTALRGTGEMTWALRGLPGSERLIEYEAQLNEFFPQSQCLALCQYDQRRFGPEVLLEVLYTHPLVIIGTEIYDRNLYYVPPRERLSADPPAAMLNRWLANLAEYRRAEKESQRLTEELEQRVLERTAQLEAASKELANEVSERKRAQEELLRRNRELSVLYTISRAAAQSLNLEERLHDAMDATLEALAIEKGGIYLLEPDGETMTLRAHRGFSDEFVRNVQTLQRGEGVAGLAAAEKRPVVLDVSDYPTARLAPWMVRDGFQTIASIPLLSGGEVVGAMSLGTARVHAFPPGELELLTAIGQQLGGLVRNARLYETVQRELAERERAEAALAWEARANAAIAELSSKLLLPMTIEDISFSVLEQAKHLTGSAFGYVGYIDPQTGYLVTPTLTRDVWDICQVADRRIVFQEFRGLWGWVLENRQSLLTNAPAEDPRSSGAPPGHVPIQRFLSAPALVGRTLVGQVAVANSERDYTERDLALVERLATLYAIAIQHQRAEQEILKLNAALRHRADELAAANKELEAFSYSVSHDLRAPLRALDAFSRILLEEYVPQLPPEAQHYLQRICTNTRQMGQLIDGLLTFSRLGRQPLHKQTVAPADLARQALETLRSEQEGRRVEITLGDLPACQADPTLLKQVFVNLLSNALKFTRLRAVAVIEVGCREGNGERVYFVKDNGVGFDLCYADQLFGVFQRLHPAEDYEGTGVGLALVQRIIHRHGGRIWAEAEVGRGATFYFTVGEG